MLLYYMYMCVCVYIYIYVLYNGVCSVTKFYLTLCNPKDCIPPDSPVNVISQSRILEWVVISFCRSSY